MTPYLAPNLPGSSTLDLYDTWEIIDAPATESAPEQEPTSLEIVRNLTEVIVSYEPWGRTSPVIDGGASTLGGGLAQTNGRNAPSAPRPTLQRADLGT
jgi:hypothetical protein